MIKIGVALIALLYYSPLLLKRTIVGAPLRVDWKAPRTQFASGDTNTDTDTEDNDDAECKAGGGLGGKSCREGIVSPFTIAVTQAMKADLAARLALPLRASKPLFPPGSSEEWKYGMPPYVIEDMLEYWKSDYSWDLQQAKLNKDLYSTTVDGLRIVFKHLKPPSAGRGPLTDAKRQPVLLLHGWPGSIVEFNVFSELLLNDGHEVVVPCLPGYGWSEAPEHSGFGIQEAAISFLKLMRALGYSNGYIVQGGDWGAMIAEHMAKIAPKEAAAIHLNFAVVAFPDTLGTLAKVLLFGTAEDKKRLADTLDFAAVWDVTGYLHEQATRPHTLGATINTTPQGMLIWIAEKFQGWSDPNTELKAKFSMDDLITNVMVYWWSNSFTTAVRLYKESLTESKDAVNVVLSSVAVPAGVAIFPFELFPPPAAYVEDKFKHLIHFSKEVKGGHFAALEQPKALYTSFAAFREKLNAACASNDCDACCIDQHA